MQAIVTKFLGATNHKGARIKAKCQAGSLILSWDDGLNIDENHDKAAGRLAAKLGWVGPNYGVLVGGGLPDCTGNCYVFVRESGRTLLSRDGK